MQLFYAPTADAQTLVYDGPGVVERHPDRDVALLFLYRAGGLGSHVAATGVAEIYSAPDKPWVNPQLQSDRGFLVVAWGASRNGTWSCGGDDQTPRRKRMLGPLYVNLGDEDDEEVTVNRGKQAYLCDGDSGAPWLLNRSGHLLAFAVYSQTDLWALPPRPVDRAVLIAPVLSWLISASETRESHTLEPTRSPDGLWMTFHEVDRSPPPPCPTGQRCCYFTPQGHCTRCLDVDSSCGTNPFLGCGMNQFCCEPGPPGQGCLLCAPAGTRCP